MVDAKIPRWFWVVAVLALIWNALGAMAYLQHVTMSPESLAALPSAERALLESTPPWATGAYAIAVWAGLIASVFLLLRRSVATVIFVVSLLGILIQNVHGFLLSDALEVYGPSSVALPLFVIALAIFLVWHSRRCDAAGWLH